MEFLKSIRNNIRQYAIGVAFIVIVLLFWLATGGTILSPRNVNNIIQQNSYVLILATGMLLCILTGNVDLSVGSVVAFVGAVTAVLIVNFGLPVWLVIPIGLLMGLIVGAFQGFFIAYLRIPAFIVTLAGMLAFRGLTMVILRGQTVGPLPKEYTFFAADWLPSISEFRIGGETINLLAVLCGVALSLFVIITVFRRRGNRLKYQFEVSPIWLDITKIGVIVAAIGFVSITLARYNGIPAVMMILTLIIAVYAFITQRTIAGRHIYAMGGNEKAAMFSGVKTRRVMFFVYMNMGLLAALAGIVVSGRLNAATPKAGNGYELDAIAACFVGGASASGGIGTVAGAIIGALVMGVLNNGMSIMGVSVDWQQAIKGFVLLAAVTFDVLNKNRTSKR